MVFLKVSAAPGFEVGHNLPSLSSLEGNFGDECAECLRLQCSTMLCAQAVPRAPWVPLWILQLKMPQKVLVFLLSFRNCQLEGRLLSALMRIFWEIKRFFVFINPSFFSFFPKDFLSVIITKCSAASGRHQMQVDRPFYAAEVEVPWLLLLSVFIIATIILPAKPVIYLRYSCVTNP